MSAIVQVSSINYAREIESYLSSIINAFRILDYFKLGYTPLVLLSNDAVDYKL